MIEAVENRYADRTLDDRGERTDVCPGCGGERVELGGCMRGLDLFYCGECAASTVGPNDSFEPPAPEPGALFSVSDLGPAEEEAPPVDEGMAWVSEYEAEEGYAVAENREAHDE